MIDRKTGFIIAACLVFMGAYWVFLQRTGLGRVESPPPVVAVDTTSRVLTPSVSADSLAAGATPGTEIVPPTGTEAPPVLAEIQRSHSIDTPLYHATFSNVGARLQSFEIKRYAVGPGSGRRTPSGDEVPSGQRVVLAGEPSFALDLGSGAALRRLDRVVYTVSESLSAAGEMRALFFTGRTPEGVEIRQAFRVRPDDYALDLAVEIHGASRVPDYSLTLRSWPLIHETNPQDELNSLRATSLVGTSFKRETAGALKGQAHEGNVIWTGVQTRYFMEAIAVLKATTQKVVQSADRRMLDASQMVGRPRDAKAEQPVAVSTLVVAVPGETDPVHRFLLYVGPTEYQRVMGYGVQLERLVDLGWSWIVPFSKALLQLLKWLDGLVRNYGVAILLLAILVRLVLHPLNMMSMKSMRAMQKLQPEMERLRAKHKDNPQALNTAVMALYRENKVNPAGGCLPMLIPMPLFIALYAVLANAIELRQAPFVGWINDLSAPDVLFEVAGFPIRLLPVLMALSGVLQQKLTPTDPRQESTMMLMNLVMVVFFYNLPSGLVLYWTVMNLLTALQQWMVLREDVSSSSATDRPAVARKVPAK